MKGIHGVFCFGTETQKKVLFVLGVSLSVCFVRAPSVLDVALVVILYVYRVNSN